MRKIYNLLMAAILVPGLIMGQNKIAFEEYTLDNGLHIILHEDKSAPIVAVTVMYHVGSKDENPQRTGFAHFFEHLLFEGSENIKRGEFSNYVENAGGVLNANTTFDRTFYFELLPSNQLDLGLWLESERMLHAKVDKVGIETQREVVKEEKRLRYDNQPYGSLLEEVLKRAYKKHPYQWTVIGAMEHLDAATEEDYKEFYASYYVPNNAVLSIAGDIDIEKAKKQIKKYFETIPKGKTIPRVKIEEPPLGKEVRDTIYDHIQLPAVVHGYRIPGQGTAEYYALSMLNTLLSNGQSSRMYKSIVDEQQLALQVVSLPFGMEHPGLNLVLGISNAGIQPDKLEAAMEQEYDKVKKELISEREFQKLKNQIESSFATKNKTVSQKAENLANYRIYFKDTDLINTDIENYLKVTREDIQRVAQEYLVAENRVALYYLAHPQ